ncbi:MAG: DUF2490 domain-containing protein [Myxococcales bacterium]|nr:DUF2490 domain-containing protein [Myxococcales bacterium]
MRHTTPIGGDRRVLGTLGSLLLLVITGTSTPARAYESEFGIWAGAFVNAETTRAAPAPLIWLDLQARRGDFGTAAILRPGVGLKLAPWAQVHVGYAWIPFFRDEPNAHGERFSDEHRSWQQVLLQHAAAWGLSIQSRTRLEQRFGDGDQTGHRARQFVRLGFGTSTFGAVVWNELFINLRTTDWGQRAGYDQDRLFLGLSVAASSSWVRIETGYLLVHAKREPNQVLHALMLNLFLSPKPRPTPPPADELVAWREKAH